MAKSNVESFVDQFVALVQGDNAAAVGEKTFRQAKSAINAHISSYEGDTIDFEDKVEVAKENLGTARVNEGCKIENRAGYVTRLLQAKQNLVNAEHALKQHKEKITFLKATLKDM